jgi:hypothetical protein
VSDPTWPFNIAGCLTPKFYGAYFAKTSEMIGASMQFVHICCNVGFNDQIRRSTH